MPRLARSTLLALSIALAFGHASANPALDIFDEAAYHLSLMYGGPSEVRPRDLLPPARERLVAECSRRAECPVELGLVAISEVIAGLEDEHTGLLPTVAFERLQLELAGGGESESFGLVVRAPTNGLGLVVIDVLLESSAAAADVRRGDRILALDGQYLPGNGWDRYRALAYAEAIGEVELLLLRAGEGPRSVQLSALPTPLDRHPTLTLLEGLAWIRIPSFLPPLAVAPRFFRTLREAEALGASGLIVDLRDNPGGAVSECLGAAAPFADDLGRQVVGLLRQTVRVAETAVVIEDAAGRSFPIAPLEERLRWTKPTVVLVNAGSASCAEFMALDLQAAGIPVFGEETAGVANSTTGFVKLPTGDGLAVTTATVRTLAGDAIPARVTPDVVMRDDLMLIAAGDDGVLRAATLWLAARLSEGAQ